jgi:putative exporter of polyketide antibiotics
MLWWFVILAVSTGAVLWAGIAFYLRVRRHMKAGAASHEVGGENGEPGGGTQL